MTEYGIEGYGLYFYCLELIASKTDSDDLTFELEHDAPIIAAWTKMDTVLVERIMHRCIELGLFDLADNGHVRCIKLIKYIDRKLVGEKTYGEMLQLCDGISGKIPENPRSFGDHPTIIGENPLLLEENRIEEKRRASQATRAEEGVEEIPEEAKNLASLLFDLHRDRIDPKYSVPPAHLATWARDIERLHRIDGRDWPDIEAVIRWVKAPGQFWAPNIMSGKKLREKFASLVGQMARDKPTPGTPSPPSSHDYEAENRARVEARVKELVASGRFTEAEARADPWHPKRFPNEGAIA